MEITTPFGVKASKARSVMSLSGDGIGAGDAGKRSEPSWDPRFDLKIGNQTLRELKILPHCPRGDLSFRNQTEHGEQGKCWPVASLPRCFHCGQEACRGERAGSTLRSRTVRRHSPQGACFAPASLSFQPPLLSPLFLTPLNPGCTVEHSQPHRPVWCGQTSQQPGGRSRPSAVEAQSQNHQGPPPPYCNFVLHLSFPVFRHSLIFFPLRC